MDRVTPVSKYNYYKYYDAKKEYYRFNYLERKRRDAIAEQHKDYYKNYFILKLYIPENLEKYKINNNINNETNISKT